MPHSPSRASRIIGWILTVLIVLFFLPSIPGKFNPALMPGTAEMTAMLGFADIAVALGIVEIIMLVLFLIPRTAVIGYIMLIGYMGGILATTLTHGMTVAENIPMFIAFAVATLLGYLRFPELSARLKGEIK